ncbi:Mdm33 family-domain-containing protein [Lactifluus subvellereus]|nr:Mdm33 family-domain-containing protein [Lactifluus subvellereus]
MLRPRTSRFLFVTFPRAHVRFPVTALPPAPERGSRSHSNDPPPAGRVPGSQLNGGIEDVQSRIRRWSERNSVALRHRADALVERLAVSSTRVGGEINRVTGYDEIEELKRHVVSQEARISASRKAARDAKVSYEEAVQKRSDSQREVNSLLERKSMWTDTDVSRFTALLRQERALEQEEARAKAAVAQTDDEVEREFSALMRAILARYHEEQVWSDKIRSVSTYGQLAVLGVNVAVFVLAIVLVEPWKRRRLTQDFERKVQELEAANLDAVTRGIDALQSRLEEQDKVLAELAEVSTRTQVTPVWQEQGEAAVEDRPPMFTFTGGDLIVSISAGMLAWAVRSWLGL